MRSIRRMLFCLLALVLPMVGAPAAFAAAPATEATAAATTMVATTTTLHYDASGAPSYRDAIAAAVQNWNGDVQNVQLAPVDAGQQADFTITEDNDWPRTYPGQRLGTGRIVMGRTAVEQGFDTTRIAAHEIGHILGLPDNRDGQCTTLMSGHSAPTSCTVADPNAAERRQVEQNFAGTAPAARPARAPAVYDGCFEPSASSSSMR